MAKRGASDRFVVYLDGVRAFEVAAAVVDEEAVRANARLTAEDIHRLVEKDVPYRAREMALKLIAVRDRSRHDIESRLLKAGFGEESVTGVLTWLRGLGYVDDLRFARHYGIEKLRGGWGERRIAAELARLGVERDLIKQALEEAESVLSGEGTGTSSADRVVEAVRRRFGRDFAVDPRGAARRLAGFLGRRGYDWETIDLVTRRLQEETGADEDRETGRQGLLP
jgi:regulatory protein